MKIARFHKIHAANVLLMGSGAFLFGSPAWSQSSSLGAHVHGEAELMIALEGDRIEMELISPAANIFGFEHAPNTAEQREQIHLAEDILSDANGLFEFEGASCESTATSVEMPFDHAGHEGHDDHDDHDDHASHEGHDDEHASHDEDDHSEEHHEHADHSEHADHDDHNEHDSDGDHGGEHVHEGHENHSEVAASYVFECNSGTVAQIQVLLLEEFPAIESLDVQWITATEQGAQELNAANTRIDFR